MGDTEVRQVGSYRRLVQLGRGGMGDVFLAVARGESEFQRLVVVKELLSELAAEPEFLSLFLDEARLSTKLQHPNIVQTSEVGFDDNRYFIAIEYLEGQSLRRVVERFGTMPLPMYLHGLLRVLEGLHYAHELNGPDGTPLEIVHRDVSPSSLFLTYDGQIKIADFGTAKAKDSNYATRAGTLRGSAAYMAPEQALLKYDRRADLFSLGVILWEAIVGRRMWKEKNDVGIITCLVRGEIPSILQAKPDVPPELARICSRALAPVAERYPTAAAMRADLEAYVAGQTTKVTAAELGAFVSQGFDQERARMREIIETQLRKSAMSSSGTEELPFVDYGAGFDARLLTASKSPESARDPAPSDPAILVAEALRDSRSPLRSSKTVALVIVAVLGVAFAVLAFNWAAARQTTTPHAVPPSTTPEASTR